VTPRHVRYIRVRLEALRNNPRLLLRRPSSPPLTSRNDLEALISATFVPGIIPGIKRGSYHRAVSRNQRMTANIAANPGAREVGRSNPLRLVGRRQKQRVASTCAPSSKLGVGITTPRAPGAGSPATYAAARRSAALRSTDGSAPRTAATTAQQGTTGHQTPIGVG
jgi:hypothetical protein